MFTYRLSGPFGRLLMAVLLSGSLQVFSQADKIDRKSERELSHRSSHQLIAAAYGEKRITLDQRILYHAYALAHAGKLPPEFRGTVPEYCGTWVVDLIRGEWENLLPETRERLEKECGFNGTGNPNRPDNLTSQRGTTHFLIHFSEVPGDTNRVDSTDNDANGTPDYVDKLMVIVEECRNHEITTMGYYPPPPDMGIGGDNRTDVYLAKIKDLGLSVPEDLAGDNPNSPMTEVNAYTSFILLRNKAGSGFPSDLSFLRTCFAHEFFHVIQNGYDAWEEIWMKEATATWIEDEVYDSENNNVKFLDLIFRKPWIPLDANQSECNKHWYGSWIFFRFLSEFYLSPNIVRDIWEKAVLYVDYYQSRKSFHAINHVLGDYGTDFTRIFRQFTLSNLYPATEYSEGSLYPQIKRTGDAPGTYTRTTFLPRRSADYYRVSPNIVPQGVDAIDIKLTRTDPQTVLGGQVITRSGETVVTHPFTNNFTLTPTAEFDEIYLIVMNYDTLGTQNYYKLDIRSHSLVHQLSYDRTWGGPNRWFYISKGQVTWKGDQHDCHFDGKVCDELCLSMVNYNEPPALDSCYLAYPTNWTVGNPPQTRRGIVFQMGDTTAYLSSDKWVLVEGTWRSSNLLMDKGTLFFPVKDLDSQTYRIASYKRGGEVRFITDALPYKPSLYQSENGALIWQERTGVNMPADVHWYNGNMNLYTYAKHLQTIPKLSNGEQAWIESYTDTFMGPDTTWELIHFNEKTTSITYPTHDNVADGPPLNYRDFDIGKGKIVWPRCIPASWQSQFCIYYPHVYENGTIKVLRDEATHLPYIFSKNFYMRVDQKKGYVAWLAVSPNETLQMHESNIYVWNGHNIFPMLPAGFFGHDGFIPFEINDGLIAFVRNPDKDDEHFVYLVHVDSLLASIPEAPPGTVSGARMLACYPNPFTNDITFNLLLPAGTMVRLNVCNFYGVEVGCPVDQKMSGGRHSVGWNAGNLPPGVYIATLTAGSARETQKIILLR